MSRFAAEQIVGHDALDPDTRPRARIPFVATASEEPPLPPVLRLRQGSGMGSRRARRRRKHSPRSSSELGDRVVEIDLPDSARQALDWHRTIMEAEMAANLDLEWEKGREQMSRVAARAASAADAR